MKIETTIDMKANVNAVWGVLTAFDAYPTWNPFVTKIEGEQKVGARLLVEITPQERKATPFHPVLTQYRVHQEMRWVGVLGSALLFRGEHYFCLEQLSETETRFVQGEIFTGLLARPLMEFIGKATRFGFERMNEALAARVVPVIL